MPEINQIERLEAEVLVPSKMALPPMDESSTTLCMVRTECCEGYKQFGRRCSICPKLPENREAVANYKRQSLAGLGCNLACTGGCARACTDIEAATHS